MRRNAHPAITPSMYRHFATVTVAITALLAFFANGENHQAVAANAADEPAAAQSPTPRLKFHRKANFGTWGEDEAMGQPSSAAPAHNPFALRGDEATPQTSGPQPQDGEEAQAPAAPTAEQIAAATAASRLRSGAHEMD